jgi:hypothetical protein
MIIAAVLMSPGPEEEKLVKEGVLVSMLMILKIVETELLVE